MHVASLELSKELDELSGWGETDYVWYNNRLILERLARYDKGKKVSAYDAGYLLRKLPRRIPDDVFSGVQLLTLDDSNWGCRVNIRKRGMHDFAWGIADTPEDALCRLAIELFKQGVLKKET